MKGNKTAKFTFIIVSTLIITACTNKNASHDNDDVQHITTHAESIISGLQPSEPVTINISVDKAKPWSKTYTPVKVITLDDSTEDIVGIPAAIEVVGDTLYIVEPRHNPGFRAYLHDGSQIFSYSSVGSGPKDIVAPFSLCVGDSLLSTFDMATKSLVFVDKKGNYIKRYKLGEQAVAGIEDKSGGIWTDYSNQQYESTRLSWKATPDEEEIEILSVPEHLKRMTLISMQHFTRIYDGTINYVPALEPRVYSLLNGQAWVKYELDYDGLWPNEEEFKREFSGPDWASKLRSFPIDKTRVVENARWMVISFEYNDGIDNREKYIHVYDKNASKGVTYIDDSSIYFSPQAISENFLYIPTKEDTIEVIDLSTKE